LLEEDVRENDLMLNQGEYEIEKVKSKEKSKRQRERENIKKAGTSSSSRGLTLAAERSFLGYA